MSHSRHRCFEFEGENAYYLSQQLQNEAFKLLQTLLAHENFSKIRAVISLHPIEPPDITRSPHSKLLKKRPT